MIIVEPLTAVPLGQLSKRVRHLIDKRSSLLDLATFVVVGAGDSKRDIETATGFPIDHDYPPWEWVLDHGGVFEAPIITNDSGACTVLIVPDQQGINAELLSVLRDQAEVAVSSES